MVYNTSNSYVAPKSSLDGVLKQFRKNSARIGPFCFQATCQQISRALEYLHGRNIIYRYA